MRTAAIKINTYARNINIVNNNNLNRRILNILLGSIGALALCYVIFLGNMVFNIIERKSLETEAHTLSNAVNDLEIQYLSKSNKIDLSLANSMGFIEATQKKYVAHKYVGSLKIAKNEL